MAEPTLVLQKADLYAAVGLFLGFGRGAAFGDPAWTSYQAAVISDLVNSGYRQFIYPPPMDGEQSSYNWSFLQPTYTADFPQGAQTVILPDDFGGFEDKVTVLTQNVTSQPWPIEWRNEGQIRQMYSIAPEMTGPPMYITQQPLRGTGPTQGQRFRAYLFPTADTDYTLQFRYYVNPDALTDAFPYCLGGQQHVETIREACLMAAENFLDDGASIHQMKFKERLAASISMDRRNKPQKIGRNVDRSDDLNNNWPWNRHWYAPAATYDGMSMN